MNLDDTGTEKERFPSRSTGSTHASWGVWTHAAHDNLEAYMFPLVISVVFTVVPSCMPDAKFFPVLFTDGPRMETRLTGAIGLESSLQVQRVGMR